MNDIQAWELLLSAFAPLFNAPTVSLFNAIASAWVTCPGRRTITRLYALAEPLQSKSHDAYHQKRPHARGAPRKKGKRLPNNHWGRNLLSHGKSMALNE